MQYIPLQTFFDFIGQAVQALSDESKIKMKSTLELLYSQGEKIKVGDKDVALESALAFLNTLNHPAIIVFDQWILQSSGLKSLLLNAELRHNDFDPKLIAQHGLFPDFSKFVSLFLSPVLNQQLAKAMDDDFKFLAEYSVLLDADKKFTVQQQIATWVKRKISNAMQESALAQEEKSLAASLEFILSDDFIEILNQFDKPFYAVKMDYVDQVLDTITYQSCTQRLALHITSCLSKLSLNADHQQDIKEITNNIKEGKIQFSEQIGNANAQSRSLKIAVTISAMVIGVAIYFLWFHSFESKKNSQQLSTKTAFEQFSKEERMQLDSLIKSISKIPRAMLDTADNAFLHLPPADMNVIYRESYINLKAKQFHADCVLDEELLSAGKIDSCIAYPKNSFRNKNYPNFQALGDNKGKQMVYLLNETDYEVLIVVFNNELNAAVFSSIINVQDRIEFKMNPGEIILFLPGNDWAPFHTTSLTERPSVNFKHHFCVQDENLKSMLYAPYQLKALNQKTVKLLLNKSSEEANDFLLLDISEALERL